MIRMVTTSRPFIAAKVCSRREERGVRVFPVCGTTEKAQLAGSEPACAFWKLSVLTFPCHAPFQQAARVAGSPGRKGREEGSGPVCLAPARTGGRFSPCRRADRAPLSACELCEHCRSSAWPFLSQPLPRLQEVKLLP